MTRATTTAAMLSVLTLAAAGCVVPPGRAMEQQIESLGAWDDPGEVIIEVNGRGITRGDFYQRLLEKFGARVLLSGVIKEELFLQEAERLGLEPSEEQVRREVERRIAFEAEQAGGQAELESIYRREGWTLDDIKKDYASRIRAEQLIINVIQANRVIDEPTLRKYWRETYARDRYRISHILYRYRERGMPEDLVARKKHEAMQKALRTVQRVRDGEDFASIARNESDDEMTRAQGGDSGLWVGVEDMAPTVAQAVLTLDQGDVSDPLDVEELGSILVFHMTMKKPNRSYDECRDELAEELRTKIPDVQEIESALQRLASRSRIKLFGNPVTGFHEGPVDVPGAPGRPGGERRGR